MEIESTEMMACYGCGRALHSSEPYVTLDYHVERMDEPGVVQVERAEAMLVACIDCAPSRQAIASVLVDAGFPVGASRGDSI